MDDFPGLLARDFGFKPQSKAAPMAPPRNSAAGNFGSSPSSNFGLGSDFVRSSSSTRSKVNSVPVFDDHDGAAAVDGFILNDVFGGPPKYASSESRRPAPPPAAAFDYDDVLRDQKISKSSSMPVYDKPVYDEDIFEGIPGLKSSSSASSAKYVDVFASISASPRKQKKQESSPFDDLLGDLMRKNAEGKKTDTARNEKKDIQDFDDLIAGFGRRSSPPSKKSMPELNKSQKSYRDSTRVTSSATEDPFVVLESTSNPAVSSSGASTDLLEEVGKRGNSRSRETDEASVPGGVFHDLDPPDSLGKSMPDISKRGKDTIPMRTESTNDTQSTVENFQSQWQRKDPDDFLGSHQSPFDLPSGSVGRSASPPDVNCSPNEANSMADTTSRSGGNFDSSDDVWLTVSEIPLFTQPTSAPPPSRPPPPRPARPKRSESSSFSSRNSRKTNNGFSSFESSTCPYSPSSAHPSARSCFTSQIDELEDFATASTRSGANGYREDFAGQDLEANSAAAAAAMKAAMEKAEAKFRHAREMRERDYLKSARSKESVQLEKDDYYQEKERREKQERLDNERQQRLREEEEKEQRRLEKERERARELEREREEREREQRRLEKERIERERELARMAVERATREARERAAVEARARAQKAAVEKAAAEARERAERAAVQRAQAEARERAAMEAREKAERAAAEARERANAEAREREAREREARVRAERAVVERAAAEARERAAAEARERAAAQARANQQKNDNDLESFFNMGSRPSSAPRPRAYTSDPASDAQNQRRPPETTRASSGASSSMRKASSKANIVDDLSSIFGAAASPSGEFQEVDGETEERRRARWERHQRTQERAAKALAEKNERDLQAQREQAERHRIAETLDVEIKRWAAGKDGNLRALLSTLQYVLWPECGWQPVSLTDLITAASVKKVYRKATLCIHPDKVQQKGASLQQKYVAEKVFDLLKEAWNKFNSEELF